MDGGKHGLNLRFAAPRMKDPNFGDMVFMYAPDEPERSYWECNWLFPNTGTIVSIGLRGPESGPLPEARQFYLSLPGRFEQIIEAIRPKLEEVFKTWLGQELQQDIFEVVKLAGFEMEDAKAKPLRWDICFETTGDKRIFIAIPFEGDTPGEAVVET